MLPLAEVQPPAHFDAWIASAFYVVGLITSMVVLYKHLRPEPEQAVRVSPQPLEVKPAADYATRDDLQKVDVAAHGRMKRERVEINDQMQRLEDRLGESIQTLDEKITRNTELTAVTRGEVNLLNSNVAALRTSLDTFLQGQARPAK